MAPKCLQCGLSSAAKHGVYPLPVSQSKNRCLFEFVISEYRRSLFVAALSFSGYKQAPCHGPQPKLSQGTWPGVSLFSVCSSCCLELAASGTSGPWAITSPRDHTLTSTGKNQWAAKLLHVPWGCSLVPCQSSHRETVGKVQEGGKNEWIFF